MKQYEVWLADFNPPHGTEPGKIRPVIILQNNHMLQFGHQSTLICPFTTKLTSGSQILRVRVSITDLNIDKNSDILIDQIRAIDNSRFIKLIGSLPDDLIAKVRFGLLQVLDLED